MVARQRGFDSARLVAQGGQAVRDGQGHRRPLHVRAPVALQVAQGGADVRRVQDGVGEGAQRAQVEGGAQVETERGIADFEGGRVLESDDPLQLQEAVGVGQVGGRQAGRQQDARGRAAACGDRLQHSSRAPRPHP